MALNKTLHLSDYTIPVELEAEPGKVLLAHGYTGAIDVVDSGLWQQLRSYPSGSDLTPDEVEILEKRGYLTTKSLEEERAYVKRFAEVLHKANSRLYKTFGFVVTYDCNFRCPYCFENSISKHGTAWSRQVMTPELVDRAFEAMKEIEPHQELHNKVILLYGGEPLLRENHDYVKYIVEKGVSLGYKFKVITNGYDLDYYEDILNSDNFVHFQISIDGWRDYHNRRKYHFKEGGSFDKVVANMGLLVRKGIHVSVRVNSDANNIADLKRLKAYFTELGYMDSKSFSMYAANVDEIKDINKTKAVRYLGNEAFRNELKNVDPGMMPARQDSLYREFKSYFETRRRFHLTSVGCTGQYGTHLFGPEGGIYSCLETVGKKEHCLGYYNRSGIEWTEARARWFGKHVGNSRICSGCRYALFCGGNCAIKEFEGENGSQLCVRYNSMIEDAVNKAYIDYLTKNTNL